MVEAYRSTLAQAIFAEEVGFHSMSSVEHHSLEEYSQCSNPEIGYGVRLLPKPTVIRSARPNRCRCSISRAMGGSSSAPRGLRPAPRSKASTSIRTRPAPCGRRRFATSWLSGPRTWTKPTGRSGAWARRARCCRDRFGSRIRRSGERPAAPDAYREIGKHGLEFCSFPVKGHPLDPALGRLRAAVFRRAKRASFDRKNPTSFGPNFAMVLDRTDSCAANSPSGRTPVSDKIPTLSLWASLFAGLACLVYGLVDNSFLTAIPLSADALKHFWCFLTVATLSTSVCFLLVGQKGGRLILAGVAGLLYLFGLAAVLSVLSVAGSAFLLGEYISGRLIGTNESPPNGQLISTSLGLGAFASMANVMIHFPINYSSAYIGLFTLPVLIRYRRALDIFHFFSGIQFSDRLIFGALERSLLCSLLTLYAFTASLPEFGFDALAMHLFVPTYVADFHLWTFDASTYVWAVMPMNGDFLYTYFFVLGGESAVRLSNFLALLLIIGFMRELLVFLGAEDRWRVAGILLLSCPLAYLENGTLFVDGIWVIFMLSAILSFLRWIANDHEGDLPLVGVFAGFALATKLQTIFLLPVFGLVYLWRRPRISWRIVGGKILLPLVVLGGPPYVNAFLNTGNPMFPYYNAIFKSSLYDSTVNFSHPIFEMGISWNTLYRLTFTSGIYLEGTLGSIGFTLLPMLLTSLLTILLFGNRPSRLLAFVSMAFFVLIFAKLSYLRYIYGVVAIWFVLIPYGMTLAVARSRLLHGAMWAVLVLTIPLNLLFLDSSCWLYRDFPVWNYYITGIGRRELLLQKAPIRLAIDYINLQNDPVDSGVAFFSAPLGAGLRGRPLYPNWFNARFAAAIKDAADPSLLAARLSEWNVLRVILDDHFDAAVVERVSRVSDESARWGNISVRTMRHED
jgi:Dolichyl-phosphate-mannose-protein mannosyltransferase